MKSLKIYEVIIKREVEDVAKVKDVIDLIDKCPYLDNDGNVLAFKKELKARINGK